MGTNTSDVMIELTGSGLRPSCMEADAQTSIPIVDVLLPSGLGDHIPMPHVNLSILGYEPDSLSTSGLRSPPMTAQEVSAIPQLDEPGSLPTRDPTRGREDRFPEQVKQDTTQGGTYVWRASTGRRREYPGGDSDSNGYRKLLRDQMPPEEEYIQVEDPLIEEDTMIEEDTLIEEDTQIEVGDPLTREDTLLEDP